MTYKNYLFMMLCCCMYVVPLSGANKDRHAIHETLLKFIQVPALSALVLSYAKEYSMPQELEPMCECAARISEVSFGDSEQIIKIYGAESVGEYDLHQKKWIKRLHPVGVLGHVLYEKQSPCERKLILSPTGKYLVEYGAHCKITVAEVVL